MELGIFSRTYEVPDLTETCRRMKRDRIFHTQLNFSNTGLPTLPERIPEKKLEEIRKTMEQEGIVMDALTGTFNMIDPDEEARKNGIHQFEVQADAAEALGISIVTLCTGSKSPKGKWVWDDRNAEDASWSDLLRTTEKILRFAEKSHVILGVETEASNVVNTAAKARKYLDCFESEHLKIIMDGANLFHPGEKSKMCQVLTEAFELLGKDIVTAHAKDLKFIPGEERIDFVAAGTGDLDFRFYTDLLRKAGYDGVLTMHGLKESEIPESRDILNRLLQENV